MPRSDHEPGKRQARRTGNDGGVGRAFCGPAQAWVPVCRFHDRVQLDAERRPGGRPLTRLLPLSRLTAPRGRAPVSRAGPHRTDRIVPPGWREIAAGRLRPLQQSLDGPDRHPRSPGHVVRYASRVAAASCEGSSVQARPDDHGAERRGTHVLRPRVWARSRINDHRDGHFSSSLAHSRPNPADSWPDSGASNPKQLNLVFQPPAGPVGGYPEGEVTGHEAAITEDESWGCGGDAASQPAPPLARSIAQF